MGKKIVVIALFFILLTVFPMSALANDQVRIFVDGVEQHYDQPVVLKNDRTYLPIRYIAEQTGSQVNWDPATKTVNILKNNDHIFFRIGEERAKVNGVDKEIPQSFISNHNRTMIPVRFVSEQLGLEVRWEQESRHIYITKPKQIEVEVESVQNIPQQPQRATPINVQLTSDQLQTINQLKQDQARLTQIEQLIEKGNSFLGTPYQFGARVGDTSAFDCSSFIAYLYQEQGIVFPRVASDQARVGIMIPKEKLERGDLLFFDTALNGKIEHVGIYLGNNRMLHVSTSRGVQDTELFDYWQQRYVVATRF